MTRSQTVFQAMLQRQPPDAYFHPEAGSGFPTRRYQYLLFCLGKTYNELERNLESTETRDDFLKIAKTWIQDLPFESG